MPSAEDYLMIGADTDDETDVEIIEPEIVDSPFARRPPRPTESGLMSLQDAVDAQAQMRRRALPRDRTG